ncbi:MAG: bacterioferritin-associated ferredoxin [Actinomycetota bacterium]
MYVCICNAIPSREVKKAAAEGATEPEQVFARQGCSRQCGRCVDAMAAILDEAAEDRCPCLMAAE